MPGLSESIEKSPSDTTRIAFSASFSRIFTRRWRSALTSLWRKSQTFCVAARAPCIRQACESWSMTIESFGRTKQTALTTPTDVSSRALARDPLR